MAKDRMSITKMNSMTQIPDWGIDFDKLDVDEKLLNGCRIVSDKICRMSGFGKEEFMCGLIIAYLDAENDMPHFFECITEYIDKWGLNPHDQGVS